ncbi:nitroreductase family protein [Clostridium beijerinckii]
MAWQTFCLAAHAKGVGTCIMGVIDEKSSKFTRRRNSSCTYSLWL